VQDKGGEVMESVPGRVRVRLGGERGWFRKSGQIDMELQLHRPDTARDNQLRITVLLRPTNGDAADSFWRARAAQIYYDLRGYLMGQGS
jgi:serine/threonine-protein kinase